MSRLPTVGGDTSAWGTVLNDFLGQAHNADGSIKNLYYNVKDPAYGAKGDGSTDDTTSIQAAITAASVSGGTVFFPSGNYIISASLIVDADNVVLKGAGQRGTTTITIKASADPTWSLVVGNTKNVNSCLIDGLSFTGRNSGSSTGGGILFRCNQGKIRQSKVALFGKTGISVIAFSGTLFEVYMEDVDLIENGMNTSAHDYNLLIDGTVSDCEYHRVISSGNSGKNTTIDCIANSGNQQKFVDCHCYYGSTDGFYNSGNGTQIIGGEYETNGANGIESSNPGLIISGIAAFGNLNVDIGLYAQATITNCVLSSSGVFDNIYANSANGGVIANNVLSGPATNIQLDTGASKYSVHDNVCSASSQTIATKSTHSTFHDNVLSGNLIEQTGANNNDIHNNQMVSGSITLVGSATQIRHNPGFNPVGSVSPNTFPASTVASTNNSGYDVTAFIANGTAAITVVQIAGASGSYVTTGYQIAANGWGSVRIPAGGSVKFTYASGAPAWTWMAD